MKKEAEKIKKESFISESPEETEKIAAALAKTLSSGSVVALTGELGAGKTCFAKGLAEGMGIKGYVKSPSFTILNIYGEGRLPFYHIDLYRIENKLELVDLGLDEYVYGRGVTVIEWAERIEDELPPNTITVKLSYEGETKRRIEIEQGEADK